MRKKIAILADSWPAIAVAHQLESQGHSVTIIDPGYSFNFATHRSPWHLPVIAPTELAQQGLEVLRALALRSAAADATPADNSTQNAIFEMPPLTFFDHEFHPFVGFGDSKSQAVQPLSQYNLQSRITPAFSIEDLIPRLFSELKTKPLYYSELTRFEFSGQKIEKLIINGTQEIFADQFIFMLSPAVILPLVPVEFLGVRSRARLARSNTWANVRLQFSHENRLYGGDNLLFLLPNQAEHDPCVGQCFAHLSVWETFINNDLAEDAEHVSAVIKGMKRLIRRALPNLEEKPSEILTVIQNSTGDYGWINDSEELKELAENLIWAAPQMQPSTLFSQRVECVALALSGVETAHEHITPTEVRPSLLDAHT